MDDRGHDKENRFYMVDYQVLCQSPEQELTRIASFMTDHGAPTHLTKPVPDSFPYSTGCKIDPANYQALADYLGQLYGQPMQTYET